MAQRKTGSITGANLDRKKGKGTLTNSERFKPPDVSDTSTPTTPTQTPANNRSSGGSSGGGGGSIRARSGSSGGGNGSLANGDHTATYKQAIELASKHGVQPIEIASLLGSDPYAADGNIPEMSAAEANQIKLRLQRQSNSIDVRHEKIKLGRKIVKMATEQVGLIGDFVDHSTAEINTAAKVIKNQIALTQFDIEQSKLTQTQELLIQQDIATQGTIALTEGIREEWSLKFEKQNIKNSSIRIEIEGGLMENDRKREEMEARLIAG